MRIFFSVGEPSGDLHGANLIRSLKARQPDLECVGFGGEHMAAAGCRLDHPLSDLAIMGFTGIVAHVPTFLSLVSRADRLFRHRRPDAVVLIDYPGFNWWMARRAHFHGVPVFYFVPPQLWAWAGWRVKKMRRWVDHVLCTLPFEAPWYQERGVAAQYVGHPFFDELPHQRLDDAFLRGQRLQGGPVIGLLPGSRTGEVEKNLPTLVRAAQAIHRKRPGVRFLVACYRPAHQKMVDDYLRRHPTPAVQTHVGRTPEIIELSHSIIAVSGSVSLELLYRQKPTVVIYRVNAVDARLARLLLTTKYICLVNLLAERELYPELPSERCEAAAAADHILHWLDDSTARTDLCRELAALKQRVAEPGACGRTADAILDTLARRRAQAA